jgi:RNA polymerase sigma-70 factor (ECF subfamily)
MEVSDKILVQKIQGGDKDTYEQLFKNYYALLCDYAQSYVQDAHVAEDQVQEVFVNIWDQKENWRPKGSIKSYLYKATRNQCLNYLKHKKIVEEWKQKEAKKDNSDHFSKPSEKRADPKQLKEWVQAAVSQLPEKRRRVYELSRDHGLTYKEIAQTLDISIKTVETQMARSLRHLRTWLRKKIAER